MPYARTGIVKRHILIPRHISPDVDTLNNAVTLVSFNFKSDKPLVLAQQLPEQSRHARKVDFQLQYD